MTKLKVIPEKDHLRDCFEDNLASIALWFNKRYELMFAKSWSFSFQQLDFSKHLLSEGIRPNESKVLENLDRYHGIKATSMKGQYIDDIIDIIKSELLQKKPVLVFRDYFKTPDSQFYQKIHSYHNIIITGLNEEDELLYFTDAYYLQADITISLQEFKQSFIEECIKFELFDVKEDNYDWRQIIEIAAKQVLESINQHNALELIKCFADEIDRPLDLSSEFEFSNNSCELFRFLDYYHNKRKLFARVLKYLFEHKHVAALDGFSDEFDDLANKWLTVKNLFIKGNYKYRSLLPHEVTGKIAEKLREISIEEIRFANNLLMLSHSNPENNHRFCLKSMALSNFDAKDIIQLNILEHFNNCGFRIPNNENCMGDLTGLGEYLLSDKLIQKNNWEVGGMKFIFPEVDGISNDNISCSRQSITVPLGRYSSIMLLGLSEWGSFSGSMLLKYENALYETIKIGFSDWYVDKPEFGEVVTWEGLSDNSNSSDKPVKRKIFAQNYQLNSDKNLLCIELPDCINMHIFAISLAV